MLLLRDQKTIGEVWTRAVRRYGDRAFIVIPAGSAGAPSGLELTYAQADSQIARLIEGYRSAGFGPGHRVALLLENRVEHVLHKLALNAIGVSCVPVNPDLRPTEIAYLIEHSEPELVLTVGSRTRQAADAVDASAHRPPVLTVEDGPRPPAPRRPARSGAVSPSTEASILYTSGTTGRPKGCILSHGYELAAGAWYAELPGLAGLRTGTERIYADRDHCIPPPRRLLPDPTRAFPRPALVDGGRRDEGDHRSLSRDRHSGADASGGLRRFETAPGPLRDRRRRRTATARRF